MRRRYGEDERSKLIELVTEGGARLPEAAARLGVAASTAYKWMRDRGSVDRGRGQSSARPVDAPTFVRVLSSQQAGAAIVVRVGGAEIQIGRGFDAALLRSVLQTLRSSDP